MIADSANQINVKKPKIIIGENLNESRTNRNY
jgi:hypothetical protein